MQMHHHGIRNRIERRPRERDDAVLTSVVNVRGGVSDWVVITDHEGAVLTVCLSLDPPVSFPLAASRNGRMPF